MRTPFDAVLQAEKRPTSPFDKHTPDENQSDKVYDAYSDHHKGKHAAVGKKDKVATLSKAADFSDFSPADLAASQGWSG